MKIVQNLVSPNKYSIKCPFEINDLKWIVIHNTANVASARNEIEYMIRNDKDVSYHYAVDDSEVVQGIPINRNTWNASDGGTGEGNRNSISIEICYSLDYDTNRYYEGEENCVELVAWLLHENWGKCDIWRVKRHYDFATNKKLCPHRMFEDNSWENFLSRIQQKYKELYEIREEDKPMTKEEKEYYNKKIEALEARLQEYDDMGVYENAAIRWAYIDNNIPDWAKETLDKLSRKKGKNGKIILQGNKSKNSYELSYLLMRVLVMLDRAGCFDL